MKDTSDDNVYVTDDVIERIEELVAETVVVRVITEVRLEVPLALAVFDTRPLAETVREPTADVVARRVRVALPDTVDVFDGRIVKVPVTEPRTVLELLVEAVTVLVFVADPVVVVEPVTVLLGLGVAVELELADTVFVDVDVVDWVLVKGVDRDGRGLRDAEADPVCVFDIGGERVGLLEAVDVFEPGADLERVGLAVELLLELTEPVGVFVDVDDFVSGGEPVIVLEATDVCDMAGLELDVLEGALECV